jgi:glycerate dehydrogenase
MMTKGVFLDTDTVDAGDLDLTALNDFPISWATYGTTSPEQTLTRVRQAGVVISNKVLLNRQILSASPHLKLVVIAATGTNNIDLHAAAERGVVVCNVRDYGTPSVVQHVFALILALTTRLPQYQRAISDGRWQRHPHFCLLDYPIRELAGRTLGIIGYGHLGQGVAKVAPSFGLQVIIGQRPGGTPQSGRVPLDELLAQANIVSLHCPLTDHTEDLISEREFRLMKNDAILINTARGGIVNEPALVTALRDGIIGGAGVDVLSQEPPVDGNPLLDRDIPNLIVTPHIAWASRESRQRVVDIVVDNIRAYLNGRPQNVVA